jgi:hypothetical protein
VLKIGDIQIDLEAEQQDQEVIIPISDHNGMIHRGMMPCCSYVAEIIIPPRKYELVEVEDEHQVESGSSGKEQEEERKPRMENVPVPLDMESVVLRLWPVEDNRHEEMIVGGEEDAE